MGKLKNLITDPDKADLKAIADLVFNSSSDYADVPAHAVSLPCSDASPEQKVYVLMQNNRPMRVYTDRALAFYECWVCTRGDENAESPSDYYITESTLDTSPSNNIFGD